MKVNLSLVLLSSEMGDINFSEDCMKDFAKNTKELDSDLGKVTNIRYDKGRVLGNLTFSLVAATNGHINSSIETVDNQKIITEFKPKDVKILMSKMSNK